MALKEVHILGRDQNYTLIFQDDVNLYWHYAIDLQAPLRGSYAIRGPILTDPHPSLGTVGRLALLLDTGMTPEAVVAYVHDCMEKFREQ